MTTSEDRAEYDRGDEHVVARLQLFRCRDCGVIRHALSRAGLPTRCDVCGTPKREVLVS